MEDKFTRLRKCIEPTYAVPKRTQEIIPISKISKSGVFEIKQNQIYDKCYQFDDVNYSIDNDDEQEDFMYRYCKLLNSMKTKFKIVISNLRKSKEKFKEENFLELEGDGYDHLRTAYNNLFSYKLAKGKKGLEQRKFLIVQCDAKTPDDAVQYFNTLESSLNQAFMEMGSTLTSQNAEERLSLLHDIFRQGKEDEFNFDFDLASKRKTDFRNDICSITYEPYDDYIKAGNLYHRTLFFKCWPQDMPDDFITKLTSLNYTSLLTIDVTPIPKEEVIKKLKASYLSNSNAISAERKTRIKNNDFSGSVSKRREDEKEDINELLESTRKTDSNYFFVGVTIMITATSLEELNSMTDNIKYLGSQISLTIETHVLRQYEAFLTALPIAGTYVKTARSLETECLAVLMPFNVDQLNETDGRYLGTNQIDKSIIRGNINNLTPGHGQIFGKTNSGKSFFVKNKITLDHICTDDFTIIIDPLHEYGELSGHLKGQETRFSNSTNDHINSLEIPLEVYNDISKRNSFIANKTEFMRGCVAIIIGDKYDILYANIVDKCIRTMYSEAFNTYDNSKSKMQPTWVTFRNLIPTFKNDSPRECDYLYKALELFVTGSFNCFAHESNVDLNNRLLVFSQDDVGEELFDLAMFIMFEYIMQKAKENYVTGNWTNLYADEEHRLTKNPLVAGYVERSVKEGRHIHLRYFGITQNVVDCTSTKEGRNILSATDFVMMFLQSPNDRDELADTFNLPLAPLKYVTYAKPGTGLLKYENKIIPLENIIPKDNLLYDIFQTD